MFAIRSGRLCLTEFEWIEDALTEVGETRKGATDEARQDGHPERHYGGHRGSESVISKPITQRLYAAILQDNLFWSVPRVARCESKAIS